MKNTIMKNSILLVSVLFLIIAASGMAYADDGFTYADNVVVMATTPAGGPNHAPSMNMNWLNSPPSPPPGDHSPMYTGEPFTNPDRLKDQPDGWAVGWGPGAGSTPWTGTANVIVKTAASFTHDGIIASYGEQVAYDIGSPDHYNVSGTREDLLAEKGYDLVIYGLGYGFDAGFESHGQIKVWVAEELSGNIDDWTLVSSWSGDPNGTEGVDYFENRDGTYAYGGPFNNGGYPACPRTYMVIDLDNPDIIDPATGENMDLAALTGTYNYIWFEGGFYEDDGLTHGNANFLDAFGANPVPIPGAVWLLGSGLLGLIGIRRRKG